MDIYFRCTERKGRLRSVSLSFNPYKITFFPMFQLELLPDKSYKLTAGFFTFFLEVSDFPMIESGKMGEMLDYIKELYNQENKQ